MLTKEILLISALGFIAKPTFVGDSFVPIEHGSLDSISTPYGLLELKEVEGDTPVFKILLDGTDQGSMRPDYYAADFIAVYPNAKAPRYVLILLDTGGSGCPNFYRLIDVKAKDKTVMSDEFGDCKLISKIESKNGKWYFTMATSGAERPDTWVYTNDQVQQVQE